MGKANVFCPIPKTTVLIYPRDRSTRIVAARTMTTTDGPDDAEDGPLAAPLASLLAGGGPKDAAASSDDDAVRSLERTLDGPAGVVRFLLDRMWLPQPRPAAADDGGGVAAAVVRGDDALSVLVRLVESRPAEYMSPTASAVRRAIDVKFDVSGATSDDEASAEVGDALLAALAKLLVGPNGDDQVGIATDASASLLALCIWDAERNNHRGAIAKRVLSTIDTLWNCLLQQGEEKRRASSCSQIRISALMIDVCLLGGDEMSLALADGNGNGRCIADKLLGIALDHPNDDPLLQMSALDQLERLTVHDSQRPMTSARAEFLLANNVLRHGLLRLAGSGADLSTDATGEGEWGEADPINGGAALRLLTEICRVGASSSASVSEATSGKFQLLLSSFRRALHNFQPQGELERLSFISAVSSLMASCAVSSSSDATKSILGDETLQREWLSLHGRASQPKLKSTVLCSLSQVIEPAMWNDEGSGSNDAARPSDSVALRLYQTFGRANNGRDSTELVMASAKSPFVEERVGAYAILQAMVSRGVGVRLLLLYNDDGGSFLDWLLNQELESTKEGKEAKYRIVDSMLSRNGDLLGGLIPARALRRLEEWRRKGPHFATTIPWEMATE